MSVTFCPDPPAGGPVELGASIECSAYPPSDRRCFAAYDDAVVGLADHHRYCTDPNCGEHAYRPFVVVHYSTDTEPSLNVSRRHAMLLLRALGLVAELGADAGRAPEGSGLVSGALPIDETGHAFIEGELPAFPVAETADAARLDALLYTES